MKEIVTDKEVGILASEQIKEITFIAEYKGELMTKQEAEKNKTCTKWWGTNSFINLKVSTKDQQNEPTYIKCRLDQTSS